MQYISMGHFLLKHNKVNNWTPVTQMSNLSSIIFSGQLGMETVKYEDKMLISGLNYVFCVYSLVKFRCDFSIWNLGF